MTEIGLAEYFGMGEAIGIIVSLFVILYFSRKQIEMEKWFDPAFQEFVDKELISIKNE